MRRRVAHLRHRVGRRGTALLAFAGLDVAYGLRLATADPSDQPFYAWLDGLGPLWPWALPWLAAAAACAAGASRRCDRAAFTTAIAIKVAWCCLYLSGWLLGDVADGWVSAAVWATFAVCVWLIAGWPEPVNGEGRPSWTPPLE